MSKLSRKRARVSAPITSTQLTSTKTSNGARPTPQDRDEEFFRRQLEVAIQESKENVNNKECGKCHIISKNTLRGSGRLKMGKGV